MKTVVAAAGFLAALSLPAAAEAGGEHGPGAPRLGREYRRRHRRPGGTMMPTTTTGR